MQQTLLVVLAAILIAIRLPSFCRRQNIPKRDQILLTIIVYTLLGAAFLAVNGAGNILSLFRAAG